MVFRLTNLGQVVVLCERSMLADEFKRAYEVIIAVNHFLDHLAGRCRCQDLFVAIRPVLLRFAHRQTTNQLELIADDVLIVVLRAARLLCHLYELCENVVAFRAVTWQLIV